VRIFDPKFHERCPGLITHYEEKLMPRYAHSTAYIKDAIRTEAPSTPALLGRRTHAVFGLATEIGELCETLQRGMGFNLDRVNTIEEIGDVLSYVAILCDSRGMTFEECMIAASRCTQSSLRRAAVRLKFHEGASIIDPVLSLAAASGKLTDLLKREIFYGKVAERCEFVERIGDVLGQLTVLLWILGSTIDEAMDASICKLTARFPEKFAEKQAIERDLVAERAALEDAT